MVKIGKVIIIKTDDPDDTIYQKIVQAIGTDNADVETLQTNSALSFPGLTILPYQRRVLRDEKEISLVHLEFSVLLYLAQQPGRVFSQGQIFEPVWHEDSEACHQSVVGVIHQLRKKLEPDPAHPIYIQTIKNTGYKFTIPQG